MTEIFKRCDETYLCGNWQEKYPNLLIGFTTRYGGYSQIPYGTLNMGLHVGDKKENVVSNRKKLANKISFPLKNWVLGEQVHGTKIKVVNQEDSGKGTTRLEDAIKDVDGLITNKKGVLCCAFFADCVPLYFYDPVTKYIGLAHAGWKGTVNRMAEKMVEEFIQIGADPKNISVIIGPSISKQYYEVDERVIRKISSEHIEKTVDRAGENRFFLDLKQLNAEILLQSGILRHNIDITNYCTFRDKDLFFSYRRDRGKTGRMLAFIGIKDDET